MKSDKIQNNGGITICLTATKDDSKTKKNLADERKEELEAKNQQAVPGRQSLKPKNAKPRQSLKPKNAKPQKLQQLTKQSKKQRGSKTQKLQQLKKHSKKQRDSKLL